MSVEHLPVRALRGLVCALALIALSLFTPAVARAQSQAANGSIEGTVTDSTGGALPGVTVNVTSTETGASRSVTSNENGLYRALLLPLGTYTVVAELTGFKKFEQAGITLGAGQTAVVNIALSVGAMTETVSVTTQVATVDAGKVDMGRNIGAREVKNLPLVARNPYNFALVQPGVSGFENSEFGVPRLSANGSLLRVNYQIDGNTNTEKDRVGLRLLPISEVMVQEVKVVTSGYAPEFGQTTGMVYNAITPSGTNTYKGSASYRFRRKSFSAFPFFFQGPRTEATKPDTKVDSTTAEIGGPVVRDRLLFFFGFEDTSRDLSAQRVITVKAADAARIGLGTQPGVIPATQAAKFYIGKGDYQLAPSHRLTARYIHFENDSPNNIGAANGGTPSTTDWSTDFLDSMNSTAVQLVSTLGQNALNELRFQYANRHQQRSRNDLSGSGPAIRINGVANFGAPTAGIDESLGFNWKENISQVIDNFTFLRGNHSMKAGFDVQVVKDVRDATNLNFFTFATIDDYLAAKSGANPFAYTTFSQLLGDPHFEMTSKLFSAFVQDDWRLSPSLKLVYGVRYDLYNYPDAPAGAPFSHSQKFNVDKNNFGPRAGLAWSLAPDTVLRASTGLMFDQPILAAYEQSIQQSGAPIRYTVNLSPTSAGAPGFPGNLSNLPPGFALPAQSIFTVDPNFKVAQTWQNNVQIERSIGRDYYGAVGFVYVKGNDLPVTNYINVINPVSQLADGRPIYSATVSADTRLDPRFGRITEVQSVGDSSYKALQLQVGRRLNAGMQFDFTYTFGKGTDTAPLISMLSVTGDDPRSDPSNLERDKGPNLMDVRHSLAGTFIASPKVTVSNAILNQIANNNQLAVLVQFNSGLPFNVRASRDLNNDGDNANDRPLFVGRNSVYLPGRYNVDMRYSRFVPIRGSIRGEVLAEFKNPFNIVQTSAVNRIIQTDAAGNPLAAIPSNGSGFPPTAGYEQREFQLGFKVYF
jgi:hypothetical protein